MQKARRHIIKCSDRLQAHGFRIYFTLLIEVLFTFPSRYWYAIGLMGVFSLTGWARQIHTGLHVPRATQDTTMSWHASNKGLSPAMAKLSRIFFSQFKYNNVVLQPQHCIIQHWFGLIPVRSPLLGESLVYFLFLEVLRCFSSLGSPHISYI